VRPIAKPILTATVILACLLAAATLLVNLCLQIPAARERLRTVLSKACGTDVMFRGLYGLPWGAIRITGISTQSKEDPVRFTADSARIRISAADLLAGKISIVSFSLDRPMLALPAYPASGTHLEESPQAPTGALSLVSPTSPIAVASPTPSSSVAPSLPGKGMQSPSSIFSPEGTLKVRNGEFRLTDASSKPIVTFTGVNLTGTQTKGSLTADKAVVGNTLIFRDLKATLVGKDESLVLSDLRAAIGGGTVTGTLDYRDVFSPQPRYGLSIKLQGGDLNRLLADAAFPSTSARGNVAGNLALEGIAGQGSTMHGEGTLLLREASIQPVDFLRQIGRLLGIEELQLLRISEGKCLFRIESGRFRMEDILLRSDNLMLGAKGPLNDNGELDLQTRLLFNEKLTSRLKGILGSQLAPAPEPGYTQVAFHVTGPALNPRTDLLERLTGIRIGGDLGGLGNLLQGFFGKPTPAQPSH
jgi:hypothetical protein